MTDQAESTIHEVMGSEAYRTAVATLTAEHARTVEDIVALTQIAAPSFRRMPVRVRSLRWPRGMD
jgi:hypothetical protein